MKQNSRLVIILFSIFIYINSAYSIVKSTYSVNSSTMKDIENWIDDNTIIFITLDEVLVRPDYQMFGYGINPYKNFENNLIAKARRTKTAMPWLESWYNQRKLVLVEDEWKDFIRRSKDKGALVFGICDVPVMLKDIEKKRYLEMLRLDINFTPAINDKNVIVLDKMDEWLSVFYQGIIFSGPFSKAQTIENLMRVTFVPKKIVYFDVRQSIVKQVDKALRPFNMEFYSVIYEGMKAYTPKLNNQMIEFQQKYFLEKQVLLTDDQAIKALATNVPTIENTNNLLQNEKEKHTPDQIEENNTK